MRNSCIWLEVASSKVLTYLTHIAPYPTGSYLMLSEKQLMAPGRSDNLRSQRVKKSDVVLSQYQCVVEGLLSFASI